MRIAAVFSQFPGYDETFLLRELIGLDAGGIDLDILSLKSCHDDIIHDKARPFISRTHYAAWLLSSEVIAACCYWGLRRPGAIIRSVLFFLRGTFRSPIETVKNLFLMPKSLTFARRLVEQKPAIVHGFWATYAASSAYVIAEVLGVPMTLSAHAHDIYQPNALLVEKLCHARITLTCTHANCVHLHALAPAASSRIVALHHGLDTDHFKPAPQPIRPKDAPLRILSVGSIIPRKGYPILLRAFHHFRQTHPTATLTIVGDGYERPRIEQLIGELTVTEAVTLAGYITEKDMPQFYQAADVFVLTAVPEIHFGLPNVVIEAMACGLPIVVTALGSVADALTPEEVGILLPATTQDEIETAAADALTTLAREANTRTRMGNHGRAYVEREFDMNRQGVTLCQHLRAVVVADSEA